MRKLGQRWIPGIVGFVAAAGVLAEPAAADKAMFRTSFRFFGAMGTSTTGFVPTVSTPACGQGGTMGTPPACAAASVTAVAPAANFTIPPSVLATYYTYSYTGYVGYTSLTTVSSYNGRGRFQANNGPASYRKMTFPTFEYLTNMGQVTGKTYNQDPSRGGNPVTPTTTFGGDFDFDRAGIAKVTPGGNRFGGTLQFLYGPSSIFKQKIRTLTGYYSKATGSFYCQQTAGSGPGARNGPLQPCTLTGTSKFGVIGSSGMVTRNKYTKAGYVHIKTTGSAPLAKGTGTEKFGTKDLTYKAYYLSTFAPWTTGMIYAKNPLNYKNQKFHATGYDKTEFTYETAGMGTAKKGTTSKSFTYTNYNTTPMGTTTTTTMKTLKGITRISSMVRPRLRHTYLRPNDPGKSIEWVYQSTRLWGIKVLFLPEPSGMLMIGAGMLGLASLTLLRRR